MPFQKGESGNPKGRPKGIPDKRTKLRSLLADKGESLLELMIEGAESGDVDCLKFLLSRLLPRATDRSIHIQEGRETLREKGQEVLKMVFTGSITPSEGTSLLNSLKTYSELIAHTELEQRITKLEKLMNQD